MVGASLAGLDQFQCDVQSLKSFQAYSGKHRSANSSSSLRSSVLWFSLNLFAALTSSMVLGWPSSHTGILPSLASRTSSLKICTCTWIISMPLPQHVHVVNPVLFLSIVQVYLVVHFPYSLRDAIWPLPLSPQFVGHSWQQYQHLLS